MDSLPCNPRPEISAPQCAIYRTPIDFHIAMDDAADRLLAVEGSFYGRHNYSLIMIGISLAGAAAGTWLISPVMLIAATPALLVFPALFVVDLFRKSRCVRRIVARRLCLQCGYELLEARVDSAGRGRCSECGRSFAVAHYAPPPDTVARKARGNA